MIRILFNKNNKVIILEPSQCDYCGKGCKEHQWWLMDSEDDKNQTGFFVDDDEMYDLLNNFYKAKTKK